MGVNAAAAGMPNATFQESRRLVFLALVSFMKPRAVADELKTIME
jgi:hypothetical protein